MPVSTHEVIFLGNFADADTDEGTFPAENPSIYTGVFGASGNPLRDYQYFIDFDDVDSSGDIGTDNVAVETISYDIGAGPVLAQIDSMATVSLTATYTDGSSAPFTNIVMFQDTSGNLFLTNSNYAGSDLNGSAGLESINVSAVDTNYTGVFVSNLQLFVCFLRGSQIETPTGERCVEDLRIDDLVITRDHGAQPIRWIGQSQVAPSGKSAPVRVAADAMGPGRPQRDLYVSRQHRLLLASPIVERMYGVPEVLVAVHRLCGTHGIEQTLSHRSNHYFHILFDRHEVVLANGAWAESLYPGPEALQLVGAEARRDLSARVPDLGKGKAVAPARPFASGPRLRRLLTRHITNQIPLCAPERQPA